MKSIIIFGPTATGKSGLAVRLAEVLGAEVVNADSRQVYQEIPTLSAVPGAVERQGIPHHLFEFIDVNTPYSAGKFADDAGKVVAEVKARGRLPVVVGGTGFYLKSLMQSGLNLAPSGCKVAALRLQQRLKNEGLEALWTQLKEVDPVTAQRLKPGDTQRIVRALEVWETTGQPLSNFSGQGVASDDYVCIALNPPKEELNARIERRWRQMLEAGAVEEVKRVWAKYPHDAPGLQAVGVREIGAFLDGDLTWAQAEQKYLTAMHQYAKRQRTWLRTQYPAAKVWESADDAEILAWLKSALSN